MGVGIITVPISSSNNMRNIRLGCGTLLNKLEVTNFEDASPMSRISLCDTYASRRGNYAAHTAV